MILIYYDVHRIMKDVYWKAFVLQLWAVFALKRDSSLMFKFIFWIEKDNAENIKLNFTCTVVLKLLYISWEVWLAVRPGWTHYFILKLTVCNCKYRVTVNDINLLRCSSNYERCVLKCFCTSTMSNFCFE
jgi:hypothetical protein